KALENIEIMNEDGIALIKELDSENVVFYIDPPYRIGDKKLYRIDYDDLELLRLARVLVDVKGSVLVKIDSRKKTFVNYLLNNGYQIVFDEQYRRWSITDGAMRQLVFLANYDAKYLRQETISNFFTTSSDASRDIEKQENNSAGAIDITRHGEHTTLVLIHGDAQNIIQNFKSKTFDLIVLDPPYNVLRGDTDYTKWDKNKLNWFFLFKQFHRILKDDGYIFLFGVVSMFCELYKYFSKWFKIWFDIAWVKPAGVNFHMAKKKPLNAHELILCLRKVDGKVGVYNYREIGEYREPYDRGISTRETMKYIDPRSFAPRYSRSEDGFRYPTTVIRCYNRCTMPKDERTDHPTQKPLPLIEWIIKGFSKKNSWILDPFLGSGTTMVVCKKLKRNCVGIELDQKWIEITKKRLNWNYTVDPTLEFIFIDDPNSLKKILQVF
ncbi:MAG: DNA methyltransferase, partial [Candidatus Njordarchaeota archaeon]